jgi:hypothetical protein
MRASQNRKVDCELLLANASSLATAAMDGNEGEVERLLKLGTSARGTVKLDSPFNMFFTYRAFLNVHSFFSCFFFHFMFNFVHVVRREASHSFISRPPRVMIAV